MSTFVLVHGAWHGAWCWRKLVPHLEAKQHRVLAPDLAGLGDDPTPLSEATLERWTCDLCAMIQRESDRVILVGHSRGGLIVSQVAERVPERIEKLVYLCAMLVKNGQAGLEALAALGHSPVQDQIVPNPDGLSFSVRREGIRPSFYGMCSDEDVAFAEQRLRPDPIEPSMKPVTISDANFGRVPRVYIECTRDCAISPSMQKAMYTATRCETVLSIDTDHSPFLSAPVELAQHLLSVIPPGGLEGARE